MIPVTIEKELHSKCPGMALGLVSCNVVNSEFSASLWDEIAMISNLIRKNYTFETVKTQKQIHATRKVYKLTGKDPNRYRPSAEQLYRRILQGKELYKINTLVDLVNLLSLKYGYSIGGFDAAAINGEIKAGIGKPNEPYEGIGRGKLNIEGLPVLRDETGGIGTPTSDEIRTAIQSDTTAFFMNINAYTGKQDVLPAIDESVALLEKYVNATNIEIKIVE